MAYGYENWFTGGGTSDNRDGFYSFSPGGGPKGGLIEEDVNVGRNPFVVGSAAWNALHGVSSDAPVVATTQPSTSTTPSTASGLATKLSGFIKGLPGWFWLLPIGFIAYKLYGEFKPTHRSKNGKSKRNDV